MKKCLAVLGALLCSHAALADTFIDNVNGYTTSGRGEVTRFTGLLVGDDGRVKQVLTRGQKPAARTQFRLDGRGRTLIPGLIDAHGHFVDLGFEAMQLDLSDTNSLAEALEKLRAYAAANPHPRWITGRGWNQERWGLGRFPTAADLDAVVPDRPVYLDRVDGHATWANSAAMKEAGITAASKSPPGGKIEMAGRQPSGIFIDAASELVGKAVPAPLPRVRDKAVETAQEKLLSNGVTAVADMGTTVENWNAMRRAGDVGRLNVRVFAYAGGLDPLLAVAGTKPTPWLYDYKLRMVGVKFYTDGALGSRGAYLKQPYKDSPKERGLTFQTDTVLKNLMSRAAMDNFQVAIHAIGDAGNAQVLAAIEELAESYTGDRRWRIEHAQIVDPADLPRFARNGIIASMQPTHQTSDWRMAEARMGAERLSGAYAWASMVRNGVPLAFGSDFPVESENPFHGLAVAISRVDDKGQPPGGWVPEQKVSMAQALSSFTREAAYASFAEENIGSLERGKLADFIFIDRDIFQSTPDQVRETRVLETWVGGRKVWERK